MRIVWILWIILSTGSLLRAQSPVEHLTVLVQADVEEKKLGFRVKIQEQYTQWVDFDKDGSKDIATVYVPVDDKGQPLPQESRFLVIALQAEYGWVLRVNERRIPCLNCGGAAYKEPQIRLHYEAESEELQLDTKGGSSWRWNNGLRIRYEAGEFVILEESERFYHSKGDGEYGARYNYNRLEVEETFDSRYEEKMDVTSKLLVANYTEGITIDGKHEEQDWQQARWQNIIEEKHISYGAGRWYALQDLSFRTAMLWQSDALYIAVNVRDNTLIPPKSWEDILYGDHLELWLDFSGDFLRNDRLRTEPDGAMLQLGFGASMDGQLFNRLFYPSTPIKELELESAIQYHAFGYTVEVRIPTAFLEQHLSDPYADTTLGEGRVIGYTLTASDTDEVGFRKQETLMTSSPLKWGNPLTFGKCKLYKRFSQPVLGKCKPN